MKSESKLANLVYSVAYGALFGIGTGLTLPFGAVIASYIDYAIAGLFI